MVKVAEGHNPKFGTLCLPWLFRTHLLIYHGYTTSIVRSVLRRTLSHFVHYHIGPALQPNLQVPVMTPRPSPYTECQPLFAREGTFI